MQASAERKGRYIYILTLTYICTYIWTHVYVYIDIDICYMSCLPGGSKKVNSESTCRIRSVCVKEIDREGR